MSRTLPLLSIFITGCGLFGDTEAVQLGDIAPDVAQSEDMTIAQDTAMPDDVGPDQGVESCGDGLLQPEEACDPALPVIDRGVPYNLRRRMLPRWLQQCDRQRLLGELQQRRDRGGGDVRSCQ